MQSMAMLLLSFITGARAEFGNSWNLVLALDVINTVVVLFYLWRIWSEKSARPAGKREQN